MANTKLVPNAILVILDALFVLELNSA